MPTLGQSRRQRKDGLELSTPSPVTAHQPRLGPLKAPQCLLTTKYQSIEADGVHFTPRPYQRENAELDPKIIRDEPGLD